MSWRRFATLLRGLGPQSASATRSEVRRARERGPGGEEVVEAYGADAADSAFRGLFGGARPKPPPGP